MGGGGEERERVGQKAGNILGNNEHFFGRNLHYWQLYSKVKS